MRRVAIILAVVITVGMIGMGVVANPTDDDPAVSDEDLTPGHAVSSAVAAGEAELESEVEVRAFGHLLQEAETPEERADLIAERLSRDEETLAAIEERAKELEAELEAGNISHGQYIAELVKISASATTVQHTMNQSVAMSHGLGEELAERGVDPESLKDVRERAGEATPPTVTPPGLDDGEVGPPMGHSDDDRGPPAEASNRSVPPDDAPAG